MQIHLRRVYYPYKDVRCVGDCPFFIYFFKVLLKVNISGWIEATGQTSTVAFSQLSRRRWPAQLRTFRHGKVLPLNYLLCPRCSPPQLWDCTICIQSRLKYVWEMWELRQYHRTFIFVVILYYIHWFATLPTCACTFVHGNYLTYYACKINALMQTCFSHSIQFVFVSLLIFYFINSGIDVCLRVL